MSGAMEPAMSQGTNKGAGNQQKARETAGSQHGARERAMESAISQEPTSS